MTNLNLIQSDKWPELEVFEKDFKKILAIFTNEMFKFISKMPKLYIYKISSILAIYTKQHVYLI